MDDLEVELGGNTWDSGPDVAEHSYGARTGPINLLEVARDTILGVQDKSGLEAQHGKAEDVLMEGDYAASMKPMVRTWTSYLLPVGLPIAVGYATAYFFRKPIKKQLRRF